MSLPDTCTPCAGSTQQQLELLLLETGTTLRQGSDQICNAALWQPPGQLFSEMSWDLFCRREADTLPSSAVEPHELVILPERFRRMAPAAAAHIKS